VHPFQFTEECQKERVDVIGSLRSPNILQPIRSDEVLYLFVDSSYKGVGLSAAQAEHPPNDPQAVQRELVHIRKGQPRLRPCLHMSWAVGPAQRNMNSTALELWGLQRTLLSLGHLATGRQINVISDNIGLTSFTNLRNGNARERRLLAFLQMYDLHLHYCPGTKHVGSDFLSRFISDLPPAQRVEFQPLDDQDAIDDYLFAIHNQLPQQTESGANSTTQRSWSVYFVDKQPGDSPSVTVNVVTGNTDSHSTFAAYNNASDSVTSNGEHQVNPHLNGKSSEHIKSSDAHMDETCRQPIIFSTDISSENHQVQKAVSANGLNINATPFVPTSNCVVLCNQYLNVDSKHTTVNHEESTAADQFQVMSEGRASSYGKLVPQGTTGLDVLANNMELHSHDSANDHTVNATRKLRRKASHSGERSPPPPN
jgi:hypothetical protein